MKGKEFLIQKGIGPGTNLTISTVADLLDEFADMKLRRKNFTVNMECVRCSGPLERIDNKLHCKNCNITAPED